MFKNYFPARHFAKIAWRNLSKHKLFSFINIFGLATGMTVCMLALTKIKDAYDYDSFHPNANRTCRILTNLHRKNGEHLLYASSPLPLSNYLKQNYNDVEYSASIFFSNNEINVNDGRFSAKLAYVNTDFYKIFGFKLYSGTPAVQPQTVVLTKETAIRFFGKQNPIGKVISIDTTQNFLVSGVLNKPPYPSHLKFDMLVSISSLPLINRTANENWNDEAAAYTYVQLKPNASASSLKNILRNAAPKINAMLSPAANKSFDFDIQPLNKISPGTIKLYNLTDEPIAPNLILFALIGFAMLLLALFNYVNLTLARSLDRAREVGIRKVAGAVKRQIVIQFLSESVLVALFAFCIAFVQLRLINSMPVVQTLVGSASQDVTLWIYFIAFTILTGLIAGWIPAHVFSKFQPVSVLKGKFNSKLFGGIGLRKTLTVIQFAASLIAIVILSVFYKQAMFMATADYGFNSNNILTMQSPQHAYEKTAAAFTNIAGVESVSGTSALFGFSGGDRKFIKQQTTSDSLPANYFAVSPSLIHDMGLQLIAGENLPSTSANKRAHFVLVNEEACRELKFKNITAAVEQSILLNDSIYQIAGVVKDFHYANFINKIQPLILADQPEEFRLINLKVSNATAQNIIPVIESQWKKLYPHQPFKADWFNKELHYQNLHKDDLNFLGLLTAMALSIACLGLLGMVIYITKNRSKEVSIRKVMGASVLQIIIEISKGFIMLLLLSVCIGLPVGIIAGNQFLQQYAYRISVNFEIIAGSVSILLLLGVITIGWQTFKAAIANPVAALRSE